VFKGEGIFGGGALVLDFVAVEVLHDD
jgi:hypothetical protein